MEYVVVAFRSRAETIKFKDILRRSGIRSEIINTPKEAGVGCGLSVKIDKNLFGIVRRKVFYSGLKSFAGFFLITVASGKRVVRSI